MLDTTTLQEHLEFIGYILPPLSVLSFTRNLPVALSVLARNDLKHANKSDFLVIEYMNASLLASSINETNIVYPSLDLSEQDHTSECTSSSTCFAR